MWIEALQKCKTLVIDMLLLLLLVLPGHGHRKGVHFLFIKSNCYFIRTCNVSLTVELQKSLLQCQFFSTKDFVVVFVGPLMCFFFFVFFLFCFVFVLFIKKQTLDLGIY